jgi:two-component system, cell cycle sensor histidine kinase and response regulator CckA
MKHAANTILLVEDEAAFAESVSQSLRMEGYVVIQVSTGEEAINIISSGAHPIDLILMDAIFKEGIDSIQAAQVITKEHNIPLLFIVKNEENEALIKTEKIISYGYVSGNSEIPVMMASIKAAIKLHKVHQELKEKTLSINESQYLSTLNGMVDAIHVVDRKMKILLINDAFKKWIKNFGLAVDTEGKTIFEIFPFLSPEVKKEYDKVFASGELLVTEETNIIDDREYITETRKIPIFTNNEVTEVITIVRDITEHKRAGETIRLIAEKYRNILETIEESYFEVDVEGNFIFHNPTVIRNLGYTSEEMIGMNFRKLMDKENEKKVFDAYHRVFLTGENIKEFQWEIINKKGEKMAVESSIVLRRDEKGNPVGFRSVLRDITRRKEVEEALRKSEKKYRAILETMEEGLYEIDLKGNYTFVNDAACTQMGYESDELIGLNYRKITSAESARSLYEVFHRIFETGKPEFLFNYEVIRKDGSVRTHQSNASLVPDSSGKAAGFRNLTRDVTEYRRVEEEKARLEQQLFQAQKMESIGRLAGGVAHDFNNMLTVILGYTELIKSRLPQDDSFLKDILEIEKAAGHSRELTRQLLAYSRKEIILPKPVDLNNLIASVEKTVSSLLGEDIDLRFYPGKEIWKIKFDPSQVDLVLINLATNARDAMPNGGKLTIETENIQLNEAYCRMHLGFLPGEYVLLSVSDNGIGMDKQTLPHVFEPFFTTKKTGKGTGLGLASVFGIIKQNKGFINAYSELGEGTIFKIYIPRSMERGGGTIRKETKKAMINSGTGTVLLVEDDDMVRKITTEMLEAIGYMTFSMSTPMDALIFFKKENTHIDLVMTDVVMPQISGKELSDSIKAIQPGVKVLFMSGYSTNAIAHQGILNEGVYFIQKPFSLNDLAKKIDDAMK